VIQKLLEDADILDAREQLRLLENSSNLDLTILSEQQPHILVKTLQVINREKKLSMLLNDKLTLFIRGYFWELCHRNRTGDRCYNLNIILETLIDRLHCPMFSVEGRYIVLPF
jgi:hypothetical protein